MSNGPRPMSASTNVSLMEFSLHWKLDGDYLRCRNCNRPHIASKAEQDFQHMHGCKLDGEANPRPWIRLRNLLNGWE